MPLDEDEWEEGRSVVSLSETILQFMEENPTTAYSDEDIAHEFTPIAQDNELALTVARQHIRSVMDYLSSEEKVDERQFERETEQGETNYVSYYRAKENSNG